MVGGRSLLTRNRKGAVMGLRETRWFCGVVVISWTTLLSESVPNYNCNSRGLLKTLRGYRVTLPRFQRQFCPWSWVSMETSFFWKRYNRTCSIGLLTLYDHVKVSIPLFCLLSISNTRSRICQCAWRPPSPNAQDLWTGSASTRFEAFLRLQLEKPAGNTAGEALNTGSHKQALLLLLNCGLGSFSDHFEVNFLLPSDEKKLIFSKKTQLGS